MDKALKLQRKIQKAGVVKRGDTLKRLKEDLERAAMPQQLTSLEVEMLRAYCGSPLRKLRYIRPDLAARIELDEVINETWVRVIEALNARSKPPDNRAAWLAVTINGTVRAVVTELLDQYWSTTAHGKRVLKQRHTNFSDLTAALIASEEE